MPELTLTSGAATDTGRLRESNEDRYWTDPALGAFLVVDGVGGQAAGERAAEIAVEAIREAITGTIASGMPAERRVREAIAVANNRIYGEAQAHPGLAGMACVLTLAMVEDDRVMIGHVGDSRLYLMWNGAIRKLTSDHSPIGEVEDAGDFTEEEAMRHPRRNEVFREVGSRPRAPYDPEFIEVRQCRFRSDAAILLCSDGLTDRLTSTRIREIVERYAGDPVETARDLVDAANDAGGQDNITALFVAGPEFRGRNGDTHPRFAGRLNGTRIIRPSGVLTGRLAFLLYGLLLGMLLWAALRTRG
jgi:serine/threonine protein phosphatase PrpC